MTRPTWQVSLKGVKVCAQRSITNHLQGFVNLEKMSNGLCGLLRPLMSPSLKIPPWSIN